MPSTSNNTSSATSKEAVTAEFSSDQEGDRNRLRDRHSPRRWQSSEDDISSVHDGSQVRSKRHRSPSPCLPECKEEDLDDDPSYRQFLSMVRSLLDLPTVDEAYVLAQANLDDQTRIFLKEIFFSGRSAHMMSAHAPIPRKLQI